MLRVMRDDTHHPAGHWVAGPRRASSNKFGGFVETCSNVSVRWPFTKNRIFNY